MGVLYTVVPLDDEVADYLREVGEAVPESPGSSRNPTPREVRIACDSISGKRTSYQINHGAHWQVMIEGAANPDEEAWTLLNIDRFTGSEDDPQPIWFEKGWPDLILDIVRRLAENCGPLVVIPDTGEAPVVVASHDSVAELVARWEHTRPM